MEELKSTGISEALMEIDEEKSELDKIFEQFLDPKNIKHNTEVTAREITAFSTLSTIAEKYDLQVLKMWLLENYMLRVSKGRGGRNEWVKIISKGIDGVGHEEEPRKGGIRRFFR